MCVEEFFFSLCFSYSGLVILLLVALLADVLLSKALNVCLDSYCIVLMTCLPAGFRILVENFYWQNLAGLQIGSSVSGIVTEQAAASNCQQKTCLMLAL